VRDWLVTLAQGCGAELATSVRALECSVVERQEYDSDPELTTLGAHSLHWEPRGSRGVHTSH
jgi:hypothetical protein